MDEVENKNTPAVSVGRLCTPPHPTPTPTSPLMTCQVIARYLCSSLTPLSNRHKDISGGHVMTDTRCKRYLYLSEPFQA